MADQFGYFDQAEHVIGLGFVACQAYLTANYGLLKVGKPKALAVGPVHPAGQRLARIINDAANYWKHHAEWHCDRGPARQQQIRDTFKAVGFPVDFAYPLSGILSTLSDSEVAAFTPLVARLAAWRDELRAIERCSQQSCPQASAMWDSSSYGQLLKQQHRSRQETLKFWSFSLQFIVYNQHDISDP